MAFMISEMVAPPLRWSMAITWAILLPSRGPPPSFALAAFLAALGAFLAGVAFLVALAFAGAPLADCAPPLAFFFAFGFVACSGFGSSGAPQSLDALPDAAGGSLAALEALHGRDASQAVENRYQSLRRPSLRQFRQFLLAAEAVERRRGCGGGLLLVRKRRNVVLFVDGKSRHNRSPWCRALRGH